MAKENKNEEKSVSSNFIKEIINADLENNKNEGKVATRFPPEPNGYIHIGHAKSICLNFGIAKEYQGTCNLRFDDTNPTKEDIEYVDSIIEDIKWLGFDWDDRQFFASDYFDKLYEFAVELIEKGKAYVDSLSDEEIKEYRGNYFKKAKESPYRNRSVEENLDLFTRMKNGEFDEGTLVLRAIIDLESSNMNMRDPIIYRIRKATHHRTGDKWCIYPMYDFAHGLSDALENITHSICTLEFQDHRPLYDWFLEQLEIKSPPQQIEFARLNLSYTVVSKRKLLELIEKGFVDGWDDPRMPTISGLRRRGITPKSIRTFAERIGVARTDSVVDVALLEHCVREDLNASSPRVMSVINPLKVVITNIPEGETIEFDAPYHPESDEWGTRKVPLTREIYVEKDDFKEEAPRKWHRLAPGKEVRLRYACLITCNEVIKDEKTGEVTELRCVWDPESKGGNSPDGRKVRGTLHWVSASKAIDAEVRLYDRLFAKENPLDNKEGGTFLDHINKTSIEIRKNCKLEPALASAKSGDRYQFERLGYFCVDTKESKDGNPVFNRTVTLRDSWARIAKQNKEKEAKKAKEKKKQQEAKYIKIDDFAKLDLRVGLVTEASFVEGADALLKLMVDIGEEKPRQIFSGIKSNYPEPEKLVGTNVIVIANLKPRKMKFGVSEGMVLAGGDKKTVRVATFLEGLKPGDKVS